MKNNRVRKSRDTIPLAYHVLSALTRYCPFQTHEGRPCKNSRKSFSISDGCAHFYDVMFDLRVYFHLGLCQFHEFFAVSRWLTCNSKGEGARPTAEHVAVARAGGVAASGWEQELLGEGGEAVAVDPVVHRRQLAWAALNQAVLDGVGGAGAHSGAGGVHRVAAHHQGAVYSQLHTAQHSSQRIDGGAYVQHSSNSVQILYAWSGYVGYVQCLSNYSGRQKLCALPPKTMFFF